MSGKLGIFTLPGGVAGEVEARANPNHALTVVSC